MARKDPEARKAYTKAYYAANKERIRAANEAWRKANPEKFSEYSKAYRARNPDKHPARVAVRNAIRSGVLIRPSRCSQCDVLCTPEGHHEDHSKPLEVIWLCKTCHEAIHHQHT